MKFGLEQKQLDLMRQCFSEFSEIESVILFGSRAMGNYKPASDVDLVLKGAQIDAKILGRVFGKLNEELPLPFQFDLLNDNDNLPAELRKHIVSFGTELYRR